MSSINNCNLESPCRLCADFCNRDIDHNIFSNDNKCLVNLIEKYLSIKVTVNDTLSIQVCEQCRMKVISFNEYALNCADTQIKLLDSFQDNTENQRKDPFLETVKTDGNIDNIKCEIMAYCDAEKIKSENVSESFSDDDPCSIPNSIITKSGRKQHKIKYEVENITRRFRREKEQTIQLVSPDSNTNLANSIECDKNFAKPQKNARKSAINSTFIKLICHICNEEFLFWEKLHKHTNEVHQVKPKILCVCNQYLSNKHNVYQHIKMHDIHSFIHRCTKCDCSFYTQNNLEKHNSMLHTNSIVPPEFKCEHCKKTFLKIHMLKLHKIKHFPAEVKKIHPCQLCKLKFITKHAALVHVKGVHHKEKPFICDICGNAFTTKNNLESHKVTHSSEKPYVCQHCPKAFKSTATLKKHINNHYDNVTFKCSKCSSTFSSYDTLKEHMNIHIDTCRYVCGFCNKGFKWRKSFQSHLNNHTGKTPFACPWCPKTFADGSNCRIHKRRKHPKELAEQDSKNGGNSYKLKRIASNEKPVIRCIQFDDNITAKTQVFPKIDKLNPAKLDTDTD